MHVIDSIRSSGRTALSQTSAIASSSRHTLGSNVLLELFPTRRTKRARGKEKASSAVAADILDWENSLRCQTWFFAFRQGIGCQVQHRVLLLDEFNQLHASLLDRDTHKHVSTPRLHPYTNHAPIRTQHRRYASNAFDTKPSFSTKPSQPANETPSSSTSPQASSSTDSPGSYRSSGSPTAGSETLSNNAISPALAHFRRLLESPTSSPRDLWAAYSSLTPFQATKLLDPLEVFTFADSVMTSAERLYKRRPTKETLQVWGDRMRNALESHEVRSSSEVHDYRRLCLQSRAAALSGELQQAAIHLHSALALRSNMFSDSYKAYEAMVKAVQLRFGEARVLEFLVLEWDFLHNSLDTTWQKQQHSLQRSFRDLTFSIIANTRYPAAILAEHSRWEEPRRKILGGLMLTVFVERNQPVSALSVHQEMEKQHLEIPLFTRLTLVRMLAKAESFESAISIFSRIPRDSARVKYYLATGLYLYGRQGDEEKAEQFYTDMEKLGISGRADQGKLLHMYAWQGKTKDTRRTFDRFFPPLEDSTQRSNSPSSYEYSMLIYAHAQRGDISGINYWLQVMVDNGVPPGVFVYNTVLKSFAMRGDLDSATSILNKMRSDGVQPSVISYTILISLLAHRKDPVGAERVYKRAISDGVVPDRHMITSLMNSHVEAGSWHGVIRAFDYLKASQNANVALTVEVYNTLLKAYVLIGAPFRIVSRLFSQLEDAHVQPDAYTYSLLVQSACDSQLMHIAATIVQDIEQSPHRNTQLNAYILTILMAGYLRSGDKIKAKATYDNMLSRGIQPTSITFGTILKSYGNEKSEESFKIAEEFIQNLMSVEPDQRSWNTPQYGKKSSLEHIYGPLLASYTREESVEDVERSFQNMLDAGGEPSLGTLTCLLNVYRKTFDIDSVLQVWPQIFELGLRHLQTVKFEGDPTDVSPDSYALLKTNVLCVPFSIYIDALSAAGRHLAIADMWKKFQMHGFHFDSHNWNHLVVALIRAGQPERAFEVMEKVILPYQRMVERMSSTRDLSPGTPLSFEDDNATRALSSSMKIEKDVQEGADDGTEGAEVDDDELPSELRAEPPLHRPDFRMQQVELSTFHTEVGPLRELEDEYMDDFAHPLHVLHRFSPTWNLWRPHKTTLTVLLMVLSRLRSGSTIDPVVPGDSTSSESTPSASSSNDDHQNSGDHQGDPIGSYATPADIDPEEGQLDGRGQQEQSQADIARETLRRIYQGYPDAVTLVLRHEVAERRRLHRRYDRLYLDKTEP